MKKLLGMAEAAAWQGADRATARPFSIVAASVMRVSLAAALLFHYLVHYPERWYLFGPNGVSPWQDFQATVADAESFSLYSLSETSLWFTLVFHAGLLAALLWMLGWHARILTVVNFVFVWSLWERNTLLLDGGDNLLALLVVYLIFVDTGSYLSIRRAGRFAVAPDGLRWRLRNLAHNAGLLAVLLQVCVLYLGSALYKAQGELWQNGTALYYAMRVDEFTLPGVSEHVYGNAILITVMTYGTVLFQVSFPALILSRFGRYVAFVSGVGLHSGIGFFMGLIAFSWIVISAELLLVEDRRYLQLGRFLRTRARAVAVHVAPRPLARRASAMTGARDP